MTPEKREELGRALWELTRRHYRGPLLPWEYLPDGDRERCRRVACDFAVGVAEAAIEAWERLREEGRVR